MCVCACVRKKDFTFKPSLAPRHSLRSTPGYISDRFRFINAREFLFLRNNVTSTSCLANKTKRLNLPLNLLVLEIGHLETCIWKVRIFVTVCKTEYERGMKATALHPSE